MVPLTPKDKESFTMTTPDHPDTPQSNTPQSDTPHSEDREPGSSEIEATFDELIASMPELKELTRPFTPVEYQAERGKRNDQGCDDHLCAARQTVRHPLSNRGHVCAGGGPVMAASVCSMASIRAGLNCA